MEDWVLEFLAYLLAGLAYGIGTLFAEHVYLRFIAPDDEEEDEEEEEPPKRKRRKAPPNRPPKKRPKDASRKQSGPYGGGFSAP